MNNPGFGIYIHWPFCQSKCPYCDFNSHVSKTIDHEAWGKAYLDAIRHWQDYRSGEKLTSIYFGGGTPSTANPDMIGSIIELISSQWAIDEAEITLEANPGSVEADNFRDFACAGVNRISMGFQAFNDNDLKRLGRLHNVQESLQALDIARNYFSRVNFDLIYARQDQTLEDWQIELEKALQYAPEHLSLYQLTIEQGTRFGELYDLGKLTGLVSGELAADMYQYTSEKMRSSGFNHYEISNFAKPGEESQHNLVYWRYGDYLGIGPGAHGRIWQGEKRMATSQNLLPNQWISAPKQYFTDEINSGEIAEEYLMMALRLEEGASFERLDEFNHPTPHKLSELISSGHMWKNNSAFGATDKGRIILDHLLAELLTE